ncbi:MAG TPA: phosphate signaling complex protein PhoU [Burkholderiales bacterium]|jgi:phosphate transport system protein|nr:phosphate signaling complex protein PhoU [Burkholderiales bacterium]
MPTTEHMTKQFDVDLETLRSRMLQMGGLIESQILAAIEGFYTGNHKALDLVIENDRQVNGYEVSIDTECSHIIARRQPAASDLRMIMGVSKAVTDLERVGDEAKKIAVVSKQIHESGRLQVPRLGDIRRAGGIVVGMLRKALDAFARLDAVAAAEVIRDDAAIDEAFRGIMRQLITFMMEDPRTISTALEIVWVARALERMGDHSKNLAEQVIYIVKGTDVRHTSFENVERKASL